MMLFHWTKYVHKPQILMAFKNKLTVALRRMNFIHQFPERSFQTCSGKTSVEVHFSYSVSFFFFIILTQISVWNSNDGHNNSNDLFFKLGTLRRNTCSRRVMKDSFLASHYKTRRFFSIMHIDSTAQEGWAFCVFLFREVFGMKPGNSSGSGPALSAETQGGAAGKVTINRTSALRSFLCWR